MGVERQIPEDLKELWGATQSFKHHSPDLCECDLEGGDPDCKIEPKCPTPYEWQRMTSPAKIAALIERIADHAAEVERYEKALNQAELCIHRLQGYLPHKDHAAYDSNVRTLDALVEDTTKAIDAARRTDQQLQPKGEQG